MCANKSSSKDNLEGTLSQSPAALYMIHKYWGKKPSAFLREIILKYSKEGDLVLDPFSGYGGFSLEATLLNRNSIANDLNPISNKISEVLLNTKINIFKAKDLLEQLKVKFSAHEKLWYITENDEYILTTLRNKADKPIKISYKDKHTKKIAFRSLTNTEVKKLQKSENDLKINTWYPTDKLTANSRIGITDNKHIYDFFPKRALCCHSFLLLLISEIENSPEKELFEIAFTANLANCSKLVPPIKSRGELAQGAWMTGYYVGETYLENNVFHYFENRVKKVIKAKEAYYNIIKTDKLYGKYKITNDDAKNLNILPESIDFIFTDFPYGDTVPYFEQSQLWNSWLKVNVDFENEIVISDSKERKKGILEFTKDINSAVKEINRVLKNNSYFVFTFTSFLGNEWTAISNALLNNGFVYVESRVLEQKTAAPRQINRKITFKGDILITYKKTNKAITKNNITLNEVLILQIKQIFSKNQFVNTTVLVYELLNCILNCNTLIYGLNFMNIINQYCTFDTKNEKWRANDEIL